LRIAALLALVCLVPLAVTAQTDVPKKSSSNTNKPSVAKSRKTTGKHGKPAAKVGKAAAKRGKNSRTKAAAAWRSRQLAPTPDRYKEIQSALATRGYLKASPSGVWDAQSTEALRHFQQDQNLEPSGKVNSLSLIALGLGAKHGSAAAPSNTAPAPMPRVPGVQIPPPGQNPGQSVVPPTPAPNPSAPELPSPTPLNPAALSAIPPTA
jgi:peptidoglycan hydrolase-like protein with peptidoglycan-binding domain